MDGWHLFEMPPEIGGKEGEEEEEDEKEIPISESSQEERINGFSDVKKHLPNKLV
jgi:hypothetical protein